MRLVPGRTLAVFSFLVLCLLPAAPLRAQDTPAAKTASAASSSRKPLDHPLYIVPFVEKGAAPAVGAQAVAGASVSYYGGPVISNVHVVVVLYGAGNYLSNISSTTPPSIASFFTDVPTSSLFDMLTEYDTVGVATVDGLPGSNQTIGHGFFDGEFTITPAAGNNGSIITDQEIQNELLSQIAAGNLPQPVFDSQGNNNTLYMTFFPAGKAITAGNMSSCVKGGFCAYHSSTVGIRTVLYGVMPDMQAPSLCSSGCGSGGPFDIVTNVAAHELSEATTDANVGNASTVARPLAWFDTFNGEIGDICEGEEGTVTANGQSYTVQAEFSQFQNTCALEPPHFVFQGPFSTIDPGVEFDLTVALQSGAATFAGSYTGTVHFTSSDGNAVLPADYTFNAADGASHPFVFTLKTPGNNQTITATDTARPLVTGTSQPIPVANPAAFRLTVAYPQTAIKGQAISVTVTALDVNFNVVPSYKGPVHFTSTDGAAVLPADSNLTNGTGTFPVTFNTNGFQTVTIRDANLSTLFGQTQNINVYTPGANATATTFTAGQNPSTFGQPVTYSATVTGGTGAFLGTPVSFTAEGFSAGSGSVDSTGHAQAMLTLVGGKHTVFAEFSGDSTHNMSSSAPQTITVNQAPTTLTVSSSSPSSVFGAILTLNATFPSVPMIAGVAATGLITFRDGGKPVAAVAVSPGQPGVVFTTSSLPVGSHSVTADYSGDANYAPSTAAAFMQVVTAPPAADYTLQSDKNSVTLRAGESATFTITSTSLNGFSGDLQFSCGSLPALATCTFAPSLTFLGANSIAVTTLTIKTSGPNASLLRPSGNQFYAGMSGCWILPSFAIGAVLLAGSRRRKLKTHRVLLLMVLAMALAGTATSCGSGPQASVAPVPTPTPTPTTPSGTTTVAVASAARAGAASASPANPNQQLSLSITVQP